MTEEEINKTDKAEFLKSVLEKFLIKEGKNLETEQFNYLASVITDIKQHSRKKERQGFSK